MPRSTHTAGGHKIELVLRTYRDPDPTQIGGENLAVDQLIAGRIEVEIACRLKSELIAILHVAELIVDIEVEHLSDENTRSERRADHLAAGTRRDRIAGKDVFRVDDYPRIGIADRELESTRFVLHQIRIFDIPIQHVAFAGRQRTEVQRRRLPPGQRKARHGTGDVAHRSFQVGEDAAAGVADLETDVGRLGSGHLRRAVGVGDEEWRRGHADRHVGGPEGLQGRPPGMERNKDEQRKDRFPGEQASRAFRRRGRSHGVGNHRHVAGFVVFSKYTQAKVLGGFPRHFGVDIFPN